MATNNQQITQEKNDKAIKRAWIAAVFGGVITLLMVVLSLVGITIIKEVNAWELLDVVILIGFAYGIYRRSRICVTVLFCYSIFNEVYMVSSGFMPSPLRIIFLYFYFRGMLAIFAYHKELSRKPTAQTENSLLTVARALDEKVPLLPPQESNGPVASGPSALLKYWSHATEAVNATFVGGWVGAVTVVIIVTAGLWLGSGFHLKPGKGSNQRAQPTRDILNTLHQNLRDVAATSRTHINQSGRMDVDPTSIRKILGDLGVQSKKLDVQTASEIDILLSALKPITQIGEELASITYEMRTDEFQNPIYYTTPSDIDARIVRIRAYRETAQRLLAMYPDIDVRLKSEMARKGVPPLKIKEYVDGFMEGASLDLTIAVARANIVYADLLLRKYALLKTQFGAWHVKDNTILFEDPSALHDWNDLTRQLFTLAERREGLERKVLTTVEADAK